MNPTFRNFALWVVIFLLVLALVTLFQNPGHRTGGSDIAYSQLLSEADAGRIANVVISGPEISGTYTDGRTFTTYAPNDPMLVSKLQGNNSAGPTTTRTGALDIPSASASTCTLPSLIPTSTPVAST